MKKYCSVNFGAGYTGQTGNVGYTIKTTLQETVAARTIIGVAEIAANSGQYGADVNIDAGFRGLIVWDIAGTDPLVESTAVIDGFPITTATVDGEISLYCTYTDLDNEIVGLTDHIPADKKTTTEDAVAWVNAQIIKCGREIDGRLGGMYAAPFSPVPALINTIAIYLATSRILNPGYVGEMAADSKYVDTYWKKGDDLLKAVQKGDITLDYPSATGDCGVLSNTADISQEFTQSTYDSSGNRITTGSMEIW